MEVVEILIKTAEMHRRNCELCMPLMEMCHVDKAGNRTPAFPEEVRAAARELLLLNLEKLKELTNK
jgi:hypothetical protein